MFYYVYRMVHPDTGEFYIGRRSSKVSADLDLKYRGSSLHWYRQLSKDIIKNILIKEILYDNIADEDCLAQIEIDEILKNINNPLCKNAHIPGIGFYSKPGYKLSDEACKNISTGKTGKPHHLHTAEEKLKISASLKKYFSIKENLERHSLVRKGKPSNNKGIPMSEEQKEKLRVPKSDDAKKNMCGPRINGRHAKQKIECPSCHKQGAPHVMYRYHFDNCGKDHSEEIIECPHCHKTGGKLNMKRWHFKNCKMLITIAIN